MVGAEVRQVRQKRGAGATSEVLFAALFADFEVVVAMELRDFVLDKGKLVMKDL